MPGSVFPVQRAVRGAVRGHPRMFPPRWRPSLYPTFLTGGLHPTRLLRKRHLSKEETVAVFSEANHHYEATSPLELNLFDDPTGGLTTGPAEELTTTEIDAQVRLLVSSYAKEIFYLLYTPFVDVVAVAVEKQLVPTASASCRPEEEVARWFTDGQTTVKNPSFPEEAMGRTRWRALSHGLCHMYESLEEVMPLTRIVRKHHLPEGVLVPMLRQLTLELVDSQKRSTAIAILPGLILGLANGRAPASMGLPEEHDHRVMIVADLFLGAGQETGNTDLAYLGIQLLRANSIAVPFLFQKQLTNVFAAAARIQTDWQMRATGQVSTAFAQWMEYSKKVDMDNMRALHRLREAEVAGTTGEGHSPSQGSAPGEGGHSGNTRRQKGSRKVAEEGKKAALSSNSSLPESDGKALDYFTSRRREDVARIAALELNIDQAVRDRAHRLDNVMRRQARRSRGEVEEVSAALSERQGRVTPSGESREVSKNTLPDAMEVCDLLRKSARGRPAKRRLSTSGEEVEAADDACRPIPAVAPPPSRHASLAAEPSSKRSSTRQRKLQGYDDTYSAPEMI